MTAYPSAWPACDFEPGSRAVDTTVVKRTFDTNTPLAASWRSGNVGL